MTANPLISIIIPAKNEERVIAGTLAGLDRRGCELIVVDGGSSDHTVSLAEKSGAKVLIAGSGRGRQLNLGAEKAEGEILLFLHADTMLPRDFQSRVIRTVKKKGVAAGAFSLGIRGEGLKYRLLEKGIELRSQILGLPYGDQAVFLGREIFFEVGGYPDLPIMEDVGLIKKLRGKGEINLLGEKVLTSGRRWRKHGVVKVTVINQLLLWAFLLGLSPRFLFRCYYGGKEI